MIHHITSTKITINNHKYIYHVLKILIVIYNQLSKDLTLLLTTPHPHLNSYLSRKLQLTHLLVAYHDFFFL